MGTAQGGEWGSCLRLTTIRMDQGNCPAAMTSSPVRTARTTTETRGHTAPAGFISLDKQYALTRVFVQKGNGNLRTPPPAADAALFADPLVCLASKACGPREPARRMPLALRIDGHAESTTNSRRPDSTPSGSRSMPIIKIHIGRKEWRMVKNRSNGSETVVTDCDGSLRRSEERRLGAHGRAR